MVESTTWLWAGALVLGVLAAHWGAERFATPLKTLRRRWGLTAVAGGAFVAAMPTAYAALLHAGSSEHGFQRWEVAAIDGLYVLYVAVVAVWVLDVM